MYVQQTPFSRRLRELLMAGCLTLPLPSLLLLLLLLLVLVLLVPAAHGGFRSVDNITVSSPEKINYMVPDGNTSVYTWRFQSAEPSHRLRIFDVNLTRKRNANMSCILVYDGDNILVDTRLGIACARLNSRPSLFSSGDLLLVLLVGFPGARAQFTVQNFSAVSDDSMPGCNEEVQLGTTGEMFLESPYHPYPYPGDSTCWWRLRAPPGFRVHLKSLIFDLTTIRRIRDTLTVYDGEDTGARNRAVFSRTQGIRGLRSSGTTLYLLFESGDTVKEGKGFRLSFQAMAEDNFPGMNREILVGRSTDQTLQSPNFPKDYPPNFECWWLLRASPGETFIVSTLAFDVPCSSGSDRLVIYDGKDARAPVLRSACGGRYYHRVKSASNSVFVHFKSAFDDEVGSGFHLVFNADTHENFAGVNREIFVSNSTYQSLKSPNFPGNYPWNFECWWLLRAPPGVTLKLSAQRFQVRCEGGLGGLAIYDGNNASARMLRRTCGDDRSLEIKTSGSSVYIVFKTGSDLGKGFHLDFRAVTDTYECRSIKEKIDLEDTEVMYLISPRYPLKYNSTDGCQAEYRATLDDHVMKVEAVELEMPGSEGNCGSDGLNIISSTSGYSGSRIADWCGSSLPSPAYSRYRSMRFYLSGGDGRAHAGGRFKLRLQQVPSDSAPPRTSTSSSSYGFIAMSVVVPLVFLGVIVLVICLCRRRARKRRPRRQGIANSVHFTNREPPGSASRISRISRPVQEREGGSAPGFHPSASRISRISRPVQEREGDSAPGFHPSAGTRAAYSGDPHSLRPYTQGERPPSYSRAVTAPFRGGNSTEGTPETLEAPPPSYSDVMANTRKYLPEDEK